MQNKKSQLWPSTSCLSPKACCKFWCKLQANPHPTSIRIFPIIWLRVCGRRSGWSVGPSECLCVSDRAFCWNKVIGLHAAPSGTIRPTLICFYTHTQTHKEGLYPVIPWAACSGLLYRSREKQDRPGHTHTHTRTQSHSVRQKHDASLFSSCPDSEPALQRDRTFTEQTNS